MAQTTIKSRKQTIYSVHPGIAYAHAIVENLSAKTGRSITEWVALIKKRGPTGDRERREWLKKEYKLGGTTAHMIADWAEGRGKEDTDPTVYLRKTEEFVEAMYGGKKAALRPLYDSLLTLGLGIAKDVKACPCKTIVPLYRNHVFAEIKPTTNTRVDLGLALAKHKGRIPKRIIDTGGLAKKDRITHRIPITSVKEIDKEVERWLRIAYDLDN